MVSIRPVVDSADCRDEGTAGVSGVQLLAAPDGEMLCVGPSQANGEIFTGATVTDDLGFGITLQLSSDGTATWNAIANQCFQGAPTCPSTQPGLRGRLAIVVNGQVITVPQVNQPDFTDEVAITGDFTEDEARSIAAAFDESAG